MASPDTPPAAQTPAARGLVRFAPTPSGFLHLGNAANAVLCAWRATDTGSDFIVRLDDLDRDRHRAEYEDDILTLLDWLELRPSTIVRQSARLERYRMALDAVRASSASVFVCGCSRRDTAAGRPCTCAEERRTLALDRTAAKWRSTAGDTVLWRRDGVPAYHLASVVDDDELGVTHIVRGADLREATAVQRELAHLLGATGFLASDVRFHELLVDDTGVKLSKSQLGGGPLPRNECTRAAIHDAARTLAPSAGIKPR